MQVQRGRTYVMAVRVLRAPLTFGADPLGAIARLLTDSGFQDVRVQPTVPLPTAAQTAATRAATRFGEEFAPFIPAAAVVPGPVQIVAVPPGFTDGVIASFPEWLVLARARWGFKDAALSGELGEATIVRLRAEDAFLDLEPLLPSAPATPPSAPSSPATPPGAPSSPATPPDTVAGKVADVAGNVLGTAYGVALLAAPVAILALVWLAVRKPPVHA